MLPADQESTLWKSPDLESTLVFRRRPRVPRPRVPRPRVLYPQKLSLFYFFQKFILVTVSSKDSCFSFLTSRLETIKKYEEESKINIQMLKEHSEKLKEALLAANKAKDLEKAKKLVAESQVSYSVDVGYGEYFK